MEFFFHPVPHHLTGEPQWQHRCFEGGVKTMYVPHRDSPFKVTCEGRYEGNVVKQITAKGAIPCIITVMVMSKIETPPRTPEVEAPKQAVAPKANDLFVGQFVRERHPTEDRMEWKRRFWGEDGHTILHIVDDRSSVQPTDSTSLWQYRLACKISSDSGFEAWSVEIVKEIVSERALARRKRHKERLEKEEVERQKRKAEHERRQAEHAKTKAANKSGGKKKGKQFAKAS